jgi:hypothetical protein
MANERKIIILEGLSEGIRATVHQGHTGVYYWQTGSQKVYVPSGSGSAASLDEAIKAAKEDLQKIYKWRFNKWDAPSKFRIRNDVSRM